MYKVTFIEQGRTGNLIFQYLACKLIQLIFGHQYTQKEIFLGQVDKYIQIEEDDFFSLFEKDSKELQCNILLKGYFQKSDLYVKYRKELLSLLNESINDTWKLDGKEYSISQFLNINDNILPISKNDIVLNLRLDDFIQLPRERSDILPPSYYLEMINRIIKTPNTKIYIICDKIRYTWEQEYLDSFKNYNIIIGIPGYDGSLQSDFTIMRDCNILIHSNSTLCWIASFLSKVDNKQRFIPRTRFYGGQDLKKINESTDILLDVNTLSHHDVFNLKAETWKKYPVYSFSYSIPDKLIIKEVSEKIEDLSSNKERYQGDLPYVYTKIEEDLYYDKYRKSKFGLTKKKGGWDCLRHYEILMNGCIPIFENLELCPKLTITTFPKEHILELNKEIDILKEDKEYYNQEVNKLLIHLGNNNSSNARYREFLKYNNIIKDNPNILMFSGDLGVNYLRDFFWIGAKTLNSENCIEYPLLNHLYDDFSIDSFKGMPGNGFTYGGSLSKEYKRYLNQEEIIQSIKDKKWDIIIYGKTGPDEGPSGSFPNLPFFKEVLESKISIAFLYGGDEQFKISSDYNILSSFEKRYVDHLRFHSQFGTCFVRELN